MAIDKDLIRQPELWQLVMEIAPDRLSALAFCPLEDHSLQLMDVSLPADGGDGAAGTLKGLENVVYDNPGLLAGFGMTTVLWRSRRMVLMPGFVTGDDTALEVLRRQFPEDDAAAPAEVLSDRWEMLDVRLEYEVPSAMAAFVRRTFDNPRMHHSLTPAAFWFASRHGARGGGKTLVNIGRRAMDVYVLGDRAPLLVNSFECPVIEDALYYLLAVRRVLGLRDSDEVFMAGDRGRRVALTALLRRYVSYVMPAIFPAEMFRAGKEVLSAPFELAIAPVALRR